MTARRRLLFGAAAVGWASVVHALLVLPGDRLPSGSALRAFSFNLAHAPLFGLLALLLFGALDRFPRLGGAGLALAFAAFEEFQQRCVPGRSADPLDLLTAAAGVAAAWAWVRPRSRPGLLAAALLAAAFAAAATFVEATR